MKNLYIFAIGGSGERVMRSFIMLMAAGVKINANRIVPIFVDNDARSKALTRCLSLIKYYNACANRGGKMGIGTVCQQLEENQRPSFFQTIIDDPILLDIAGDQIGDLKTIIGRGLAAEDPVQKAILEERDLLFSEDDLAMKLTVGFVGNPNIGSVVLNALSFADPKFAEVVQNAGQGDGVMVIGSLFGGTGAAGFPLIINRFMRSDKSRPTIGGVAVLPYFDFGTEDLHDTNEKIINTDKWDVNSDSFSTKTRAALMYYDDYMRGMDYLYYVGDDNRAVYDHYVGGEKQDNPVHLVEVLSAMSIIDFAKQNNQDNIVYKQPVWGVAADPTTKNPTVCNVSSVKNEEVKRALVKFQMLREYFINKKDGFLFHAIANHSAIAQDLGFTEIMRCACVGEDSNKVYKDGNEMANVVETETKNFPYAWGFNAFMKEWVAWFADLKGIGCRRTFSIFPNDAQDIDQNNITEKFYSEKSHGIAATYHRKRLFKDPVEVSIYPDIATYILRAHNKNKWANIPEDRKLAALLKTISDGLDNVIDNTCTL